MGSKLISTTPLLGILHVGVSGLVLVLHVACRAWSRILNDLECSLSNVCYIKHASVLKHLFRRRRYRISSYCSVVSETVGNAVIKSCHHFLKSVYISSEVEISSTSSKYWPVRDCSIVIPPKSLLLLQISYWGIIQLFCCALLQIRGKTPTRCTKNLRTLN